MSTFSQDWQSLERYGFGLVGLAGTRKLVSDVLRGILLNFNPETQTLEQLQETLIMQFYRQFYMIPDRRLLPGRRPGTPKVEVDILRQVATVGSLGDIYLALLTNGREYQSGNISFTGIGQVAIQAPTTGVKQAAAGSTSRDTTTQTTMPLNSTPSKSTAQKTMPQKSMPQKPMPQKPMPQKSMPQKSTPAPGATKTQPGKPGPASATPQESAPKIKGAENWEIIFPKAINIVTYIDPYKRSLEALLGVHLNIKYEVVPRLFIGDSLSKPTEAPDYLQRLVNCERRVKAWEDLMEYAKECHMTKKCQDIMTFMIARKTGQVKANLQAANQLVCQASKSGIAGGKTGVPPTPTGIYREYDARARAATPQVGQTQGNKKQGY